MRSAVYIFISMFFFAGAAFAASLDEVRASINTGLYDQAFEQASALGSAEGLLLAAESLNTKVMLGQSKSAKKDARRAMKLAGRVLEKNPNHKGASLQYAIAHGFYGREVSAVTAWRKNLPPKIKASILDAKTLNNSGPQSTAMLGAWHYSVVYKAGAKRAKKSYDATQSEGQQLYEQALAAAPDDILIRANYVMMLYALAPKDNEAQVKALLLGFQGLQPENALETKVLSNMSKFETSLTQPKTAMKLAKTFLNW